MSLNLALNLAHETATAVGNDEAQIVAGLSDTIGDLVKVRRCAVSRQRTY